MELNFSNKNEDEDELETKGQLENESMKQEIEEGIDDDKGEKLKFEEDKDFSMKK